MHKDMSAKEDIKRNIESADVFENTTYSIYPCSSYRGLTVYKYIGWLDITMSAFYALTSFL